MHIPTQEEFASRLFVECCRQMGRQFYYHGSLYQDNGEPVCLN